MHHENKIYLASKSPRRRELLRQVHIDFDVLLLREAPPRGPDVTEALRSGESAEDYVRRVTQEKAEKAWEVLHLRKLPPRIVLSADTSVVVDQRILGKPADIDAAQAMLTSLSGRSHQVITALCAHDAGRVHVDVCCSRVRFAALSADEIRAYCHTHEPYDKAGGYGIQGLAARFIEHIEGSYSGIMGLPLFETCRLLARMGLAI